MSISSHFALNVYLPIYLFIYLSIHLFAYCLAMFTCLEFRFVYVGEGS